jgi:hypothetical protein
MSLLEMLIVVAVIGVLSLVAIPMTGGALSGFRINGDIRSVSGGIAVAKMRAASAFTRTRFYADLGGGTYRVETWNRATSTWVNESGADTALSAGVQFGFGPVTTAPPNTQGTIGQAPPCTDNVGADIPGTACVMFNSRGVPVDATFAPTSAGAVYLIDIPPTVVHGVTVAATGLSRSWSTQAAATPNWVRN